MTTEINTAELREACNNVLDVQCAIHRAKFNALASPQNVLALLDRLDPQQAKIDALMLEYCPNEMAPEQVEVWGKNQRCVNGPAASQQGSEPVAYMFHIRLDGKGNGEQFAAIDYDLQPGQSLISKRPLVYDTNPIAPADKAVLARGDAGSVVTTERVRDLEALAQKLNDRWGECLWIDASEMVALGCAIAAAQEKKHEN